MKIVSFPAVNRQVVPFLGEIRCMGGKNMSSAEYVRRTRSDVLLSSDP